MLSANIFYSIYSLPLGVLSLLIGFASIFLIYESKDFKGLFLFLIGCLFFFLSAYFSTSEHHLYKLGLSYNFVVFVEMIIALASSVLWLNASSELHSNQPTNRLYSILYVSICLPAGVYYSFIAYDHALAMSFSNLLISISLGVFLAFCVERVYKNFTIGNLFLSLAVFVLFFKLVISYYFFRYNWLNLNLLNWIWVYIFAISMVFMRIDRLKEELQKNWNIIDKLNLQFSHMVNSSPFPIIIAKLNGNQLLLINGKAEELFGITAKEMNYCKLSDFLIDEENRKNFFSMLEKRHEVEDFDLMVANLISSTPFWLSVSAKTIEYNNEMALYMAFQNITLRKERESKLQTQADRDPLTQAWNRRYFEKTVPQRISSLIQAEKYYSLLMIDADKFKNINDTYGHKTGDKVLINIVDVCTHSLRNNDLVCRFGGEEFMIYLEDTNSDSALKVAERLRISIAESSVFADSGEEIKITVSIGVVSSEKTDSLEVLLRQADDAMYLAKHNGRNRVELYNETKVKAVLKTKSVHTTDTIHPVFQNEEVEEISLLDDYDNRIIKEEE
ncbi:MAG: GGDEF domain-containing protein [Alphaproteobacteria bacterium]|nr:GGDEF domain-containing protein [Alphaproteobacteria bacterium]